MSALGAYLQPTSTPPAHVRERPWRGVFFGDDETEESIASWLAEQVSGRGGDIQSVVDLLAPRKFPGWAELLAGERLDEDEAVHVSPDVLDETTFAFIFDIEGRRLDVFATHADANGELMGSLWFDRAGVAAPWTLEPPIPPRLTSPLVPGWEGSKPFSDAQSRQELRVALIHALQTRGMDPRASLDALSRHLAEHWRTTAGGTRRILLPPADVSGFWEVRLLGVDVWYPVPGQRHALFASPGELVLFAAGSARAFLVRIDFDALTEQLGGDPSAEAMVAALRETTTESGWVVDVLDLLRGEQVPEGDSSSGA